MRGDPGDLITGANQITKQQRVIVIIIIIVDTLSLSIASKVKFINFVAPELGTDKVGDRGLFKEGRISESEELFDNDESNGGKESKEENIEEIDTEESIDKNIEEIDTEESIDKEYQKEMHKSPFVGCFMSENALRYHLRRMWSKYGFIDVHGDANGGCFFKFKNEEDMEKVIEQGPWIVNHKLLFVQKWDPNIGLEKKEETKIPIWARMKNIPLEAWTKDGISA
ncbi:RNA-directed DNA polymerase, eukaryota, reverse transcriptase zinc-binding domain protein [Tanacetum coccineum]